MVLGNVVEQYVALNLWVGDNAQLLRQVEVETYCLLQHLNQSLFGLSLKVYVLICAFAVFR